MEKTRLKQLLYKAIKWIEDDCADFFVSEVGNEYEWFEDAIGITEEELTELGITLSKGSEEDEIDENEGD
ncbi:MAG: hypothetical protein E7346_04550 [Clostridiales bacterium]|nr:hypothetical protein [Clostridiales bacterium]